MSSYTHSVCGISGALDDDRLALHQRLLYGVDGHRFGHVDPGLMVLSRVAATKVVSLGLHLIQQIHDGCWVWKKTFVSHHYSTFHIFI